MQIALSQLNVLVFMGGWVRGGQVVWGLDVCEGVSVYQQWLALYIYPTVCITRAPVAQEMIHFHAP